MRIISGTLKGRKLFAPTGMSLRPTSDRVKESLFNILGNEVKGKIVLDLFAGTGNIGLEALSRGAKRVVFVEKDEDAFRCLRRNLTLCGMENRSDILRKDVFDAIDRLGGKKELFDLLFMDPPYERGLIQKTLRYVIQNKVYHDGSLLILEHNRRESLTDLPAAFKQVRQRKTGDTLISFLCPSSSPSLRNTAVETE
jgi:16S rRNA (guanine966-N2)-methyltransferase